MKNFSLTEIFDSLIEDIRESIDENVFGSYAYNYQRLSKSVSEYFSDTDTNGSDDNE